jgi:hypothetical protein
MSEGQRSDNAVRVNSNATDVGGQRTTAAWVWDAHRFEHFNLCGQHLTGGCTAVSSHCFGSQAKPFSSKRHSDATRILWE